jgi:hypothetical protein
MNNFLFVGPGQRLRRYTPKKKPGKNSPAFLLSEQLFPEFSVNRHLDFFNRFSLFMKLGDPQGLLLTESSAGSVIFSKTAQKRKMMERRLITITVTEDFI